MANQARGGGEWFREQNAQACVVGKRGSFIGGFTVATVVTNGSATGRWFEFMGDAHAFAVTETARVGAA